MNREAELEACISELRARLKAAGRELEALCHAVAHDVRAPLRGIEGFSQALVDFHAAELSPEARELVGWIHDGSRRMSLLIEDLIKLAQIPSDPGPATAVDVARMAHAIVAELRASSPGRQVEVVIAPELGAFGDRQLLRLALSHLLQNAWKFTSKHATARLEIGKTGDPRDPTFFVRDDGAGFDAIRAPRLFGAFQRFHPAHEFEGRGIGLAIVRRVIDLHGGSIWAESAVERGATFFFTLGRGPERIRAAD